jgi:transcriptional regulator with XRE-family HTH domain
MEKKHPNLVKIGRKIRALRKAQHYSQEDFAATAELGRSYMGRVERGEQNISMQSLIQIALTLKVEVGELFPPLRELKTPYRKRPQ